jgi:hypothetical protein
MLTAISSHGKPESIDSQMQSILNLVSLITIDSVNRLTETLGYKTVKLVRFTEPHGVINMIYFVTVENNAERLEWVLRVTNPWEIWTGRLPMNESTILNIIGRWNDSCIEAERRIPVTKILSFSADASTSLLGCEYSLGEKIAGSNLEASIKMLGHAQRHTLWKDYLRIQKNLCSIPASFVFNGVSEPFELERLSTSIGSFCNGPNTLGPIIRDGSAIGPSKSLSELMIESFRRSIHDIEHCQSLHATMPKTDIETLLNRIIGFLEKISSQPFWVDKMWPNSTSLGICHDDLHAGNILVDIETGHITAVLDWDRVSWGIASDQANEWGSSLCCDLFTNDELQRAKDELETLFPDTVTAKLRNHFCSLADNLSWMTHIAASWLGAPNVDAQGKLVPYDIELLADIHRAHMNESMTLFGNVDTELARGEDAFTTEPKYDKEESTEEDAEDAEDAE